MFQSHATFQRLDWRPLLVITMKRASDYCKEEFVIMAKNDRRIDVFNYLLSDQNTRRCSNVTTF